MEYHTASSPNIFESTYARGSIKTNCLRNEAYSAYIPFPRDWKLAIAITSNAAKIKQRLHILRAGIPSLSISSFGLKSIISSLGNNQKIAVPITIITKDDKNEYFNTFMIRSLFLAP